MDFLQQMAESSRERANAAKRHCPEAQMLRLAASVPAPPALRFSGTGFDLIAEVKLRSPAAGAFGSDDGGIEQRATTYASAGAAAVSVLTEPSRFDGSMTHLESAARALCAVRVPAMRKDFLVDPYQVAEARAAGAGGVLVILRMLPRNDLDALLRAARQLQLFVLLEAFDERDIELAHELVGKHGTEGLLIGVNCRDLATLQVVPGRLEKLAPLLPTAVPRVAESGVATAEDARRVSAAGYDLALVGSALMLADDPAALVREMLGAGGK
jgi:indole-3-glycerol phosphate synthase